MLGKNSRGDFLTSLQLESVYLLDLVQLRLDEKALSLLTILSPFLFIIFLGISDHSIARWNTNIKLVSGLLTIVLRVVAFWLPTPILKLIFAALGTVKQLRCAEMLTYVCRGGVLLDLFACNHWFYNQEKCQQGVTDDGSWSSTRFSHLNLVENH